MSIRPLNSDNLEYFTITTTPSRSFSSGSSFADQPGITGTLDLYAQKSDVEKELYPLSLFSASYFNDEDLDETRKAIAGKTKSNIQQDIAGYMDSVRAYPASTRKQQTLNIFRFKPNISFGNTFLRKKVVQNLLYPFYKSKYPSNDWSFPNYNCLNFFTSSNVPSSSVLLYPNQRLTSSAISSVSPSQYGAEDAFSIDFWIKPRVNEFENEYKPGSVFHLSGAYVVSIHSGSTRDFNGHADRFRVVLQIGRDVGKPPATLNLNSLPSLTFATGNALVKNRWQHVTIRWPGPNINEGSGSILVDRKNVLDFQYAWPSELGFFTSSIGSDVLCIGNYAEWKGNRDSNSLAQFFTTDAAERDGLVALVTGSDFAPNKDLFNFSHPLNAEVHDLKLYDKFLNDGEVEHLQSNAPKSLKNLRFYLPPFFTYESPFRKFVGNGGGVLVTPFQTRNGETYTPFLAQMAFSVDGHYINLENYVRDFATGRFPRLWELTGSAFTPASNVELSANTFLYNTGSNIRRLYTVLPNDNGYFSPNFNFLAPLSSSRFVNDKGNYEPGIISLNNIVSGSPSSHAIQTNATSSMVNDIVGASPENIFAFSSDELAILHRLKDGSSNQVTMFDVSNLYYGKRIRPGTLVLSDNNLTGSRNRLSALLKDNGRGGLYRADSSGSQATWNAIGDVFYDEGLIVIKHPQYHFFGKEQFSMELQGEQDVHVLTINAQAAALDLVSSSNPNYLPVSASEDLANEPDEKFVYISTVNIHDDNLNVIMRAKLSSPIVKRTSDRMTFVLKRDY